MLFHNKKKFEKNKNTFLRVNLKNGTFYAKNEQKKNKKSRKKRIKWSFFL